MSVEQFTTILCDGKGRKCLVSSSRNKNVTETRKLLRVKGWRTRRRWDDKVVTWRTFDYCPACAKKLSSRGKMNQPG